MCEIKDIDITCKDYDRFLDCEGFIVSEKRGFTAFINECGIEIYESENFNKIKDVRFRYPSGFCMNPAETKLMCYGSGYWLMIMDTITWENEMMHLNMPKSTDDSGFEIGKIFYISEQFLLITSSTYGEIFVYDIVNGIAEKVHTCYIGTISEIHDFEYDREKNAMTFIRKVHPDVELNSKWFEYRTNYKTAESELLGLNITVNYLKIMRDVVYCSPEHGSCILYNAKRKLFGKKHAMFTYYDARREIEYNEDAGKAVFRNTYCSCNTPSGHETGYKNLVVMPFQKGISICRIDDEKLKHVGSFDLGYMWEYTISDDGRRIIALGDDMMKVITVS